jgi:hypothetical protein
MIDRHSSDQHAAEHKTLREHELQLVHQRDLARGWVVQLESMLEGTCQLLREYGVWPCLDCHQGEPAIGAGTEVFDRFHHDPECRIAKVLADADADRGSGS